MDESVETTAPESDAETTSNESDRRQERNADPVPPSLSLAEGTAPAKVLEELRTMQEETLSLEQLIAATEANMREFESKTKYMDAERERKTLARLKARRKALSQRHVESYQKVDSQQLHAFANSTQQAFDERWEKFLAGHNKKTRKMYHALKERHQKELAKLRDELEKKIRVPKYSTHLLGLRQKQRALARCQRYVEAETILKSADVLEAKEREEYRRNCQQQNQGQVDMMLNQQYVDMSALRQKTKLERKVMMEDRSKEQKQLDHRLRNSMMEMTRMHTKQALVAEGKLFDTGFYTQRGAARSSKPLASELLLTSTSSHSNTVNITDESKAVSAGNYPGEATAVSLSARNLPPLKCSQKPQKNVQQIRAGAHPKSHEKLTMKEDLYKQKKSTPRNHSNRSVTGAGKEQCVPGRRRQEFSIRKLARDRAKGRS